MTCLFKIELRAILSTCLICFAKNRVEWLSEELVVKLPAKVVSHDELDSLNWICRVCSFIHVNG